MAARSSARPTLGPLLGLTQRFPARVSRSVHAIMQRINAFAIDNDTDRARYAHVEPAAHTLTHACRA